MKYFASLLCIALLSLPLQAITDDTLMKSCGDHDVKTVAKYLEENINNKKQAIERNSVDGTPIHQVIYGFTRKEYSNDVLQNAKNLISLLCNFGFDPNKPRAITMWHPLHSLLFLSENVKKFELAALLLEKGSMDDNLLFYAHEAGQFNLAEQYILKKWTSKTFSGSFSGLDERFKKSRYEHYEHIVKYVHDTLAQTQVPIQKLQNQQNILVH